jgi:hypothetical protein
MNNKNNNLDDFEGLMKDIKDVDKAPDSEYMQSVFEKSLDILEDGADSFKGEKLSLWQKYKVQFVAGVSFTVILLFVVSTWAFYIPALMQLVEKTSQDSIAGLPKNTPAIQPTNPTSDEVFAECQTFNSYSHDTVGDLLINSQVKIQSSEQDIYNNSIESFFSKATDNTSFIAKEFMIKYQNGEYKYCTPVKN